MEFRFKEFSVEHGRSTQRVTTDSVLLGAWLEVPEKCQSVLDVGTGCGLLALMMAQRCQHARVDAIDIDDDSVQECDENFRRSPWSGRLNIYKADYAQWNTSGYDLIVSNPPYFMEDTLSPVEARNRARHTATLDTASLIQRASQLLAPEGSVALVCPASQGNRVRTEAAVAQFKAVNECLVSTVEGRAPALSLFQLFKQPCESRVQRLAIRHDNGGGYTEEYTRLTNRFYLFLHI